MSPKVNAAVAIVGEINRCCGRRDRLSVGRTEGYFFITLPELLRTICSNREMDWQKGSETLGFVHLVPNGMIQDNEDNDPVGSGFITSLAKPRAGTLRESPNPRVGCGSLSKLAETYGSSSIRVVASTLD